MLNKETKKHNFTSLLKKYSTIHLSGDKETGEVFLTSGFQPPFAESDLWRQVDATCHFQSYATGGAILHLFMNEELSPETTQKLIDTITSVPVQYFTITPVLSVCNDCGHKLVGRYRRCPNCDSLDITFHTRPIGYFRPVMRCKISDDFKKAEHEFSLRARIVDYATRKYIEKSDVEELIDEINSLV